MAQRGEINPPPDLYATALFSGAVLLTVICTVLVGCSIVWGWPGELTDLSAALMVVAWIGAFERRRVVADRRDRSIEAEIAEVEQYLRNR